MDDSVYEKYKLAGKIASNARDQGAKLVKEGISYLEVATKIESDISENGAGLAFPVNISINEIAAHFTPRHDDISLVFKKGDVVLSVDGKSFFDINELRIYLARFKWNDEVKFLLLRDAQQLEVLLKFQLPEKKEQGSW